MEKQSKISQARLFPSSMSAVARDDAWSPSCEPSGQPVPHQMGGGSKPLSVDLVGRLVSALYIRTTPISIGEPPLGSDSDLYTMALHEPIVFQSSVGRHMKIRRQ